VIYLTVKDKRQIKKTEWVFDWNKQIDAVNRQTCKLVIKDNPNIIQGLISFTDEGDHIYMHLIESAKFNKGKSKLYAGVPGNLVAFVCNVAFDRGYESYVAFDAKTVLIRHYIDTLNATHFRGTKMLIETSAATKLVNRYFKK